MKTTIEIKPDQIDSIILAELKWALDSFEEDILRYESGKSTIAVFDTDPVKDVQMLSEYVAAFKKVITYYGTE